MSDLNTSLDRMGKLILFKKTLEEVYGEEWSAFWQEQFIMYMQGCRDVRMHDTTLVELSK